MTFLIAQKAIAHRSVSVSVKMHKTVRSGAGDRFPRRQW